MPKLGYTEHTTLDLDGEHDVIRIIHRPGQSLRIGLLKNGREQVSSWADRTGYQTAVGSTLLELRQGDIVQLRVRKLIQSSVSEKAKEELKRKIKKKELYESCMPV